MTRKEAGPSSALIIVKNSVVGTLTVTKIVVAKRAIRTNSLVEKKLKIFWWNRTNPIKPKPATIVAIPAIASEYIIGLTISSGRVADKIGI